MFFQKRACPVHGTCLVLTSLYWLMWFDSLPLLGPGGLAIFFFCVCLCVFFGGERERERDISKHQVSWRTPYPFNYAAHDSNRFECAHCCCWGWLWVHMRAPACLDPSLKSESGQTDWYKARECKSSCTKARAQSLCKKLVYKVRMQRSCA